MKLKTILRANAASCLIFGALFAVLPSAIASFLSANPPPVWLIAATGAILIFNGIHLLWISTKTPPTKWEIFYFSAGDFGWVAGTLILIAMNLWITNPIAIAVALGTATMVGLLGAIQLRALPQF